MRPLHAKIGVTVFRILLPFIVRYLGNRQIRIAHQDWVEMLARHLQIIQQMKEMTERSGEIATLRVKYPRVYKRLHSHIKLMEDQANLVMSQFIPTSIDG